jgi:hypothetical protein
MPEDGLRFVFGSIKETDLVAVSLLSSKEVTEDVAIVCRLTGSTGDSLRLPTTPSKRSLGQRGEMSE